MKRLSLPLLFVIAATFASSASACEICRLWSGQSTCWSGASKGFQWCYGGWGTPCTLGDSCIVPPPEGGSPTTLARSEQVCTEGVLGCSEAPDRAAAPSGFVLNRPEVTAERPKPAK